MTPRYSLSAFVTRSLFLALLFIATAAFADKQVNAYNAPTGSGKSVAHGCTYVLFDLVGFTGTISGASFSNQTVLLPIPASQDGMTLSAIPYTVTSGTLIIVEQR